MAQKAKSTAAAPAFAYFRNQSPQGALQLPLVGAVVAHGAVVAVPIDRAHLLAGQEVWAPVDGPDDAECADNNNDDSGEAAAITKE